MSDKMTGFALSRLVSDGTQPNTSGAANSVARVIADHYYPDKGYAEIAIPLILIKSPYSIRQVKRAITEMEESGLWTVERGSGRTRTRYTPNIALLEQHKAENFERFQIAVAEEALSLNLEEEEEKDGVKPDWLAEEEEEEEDTPLPPKQAVEEEETPKPVEASTSPEKITPTHSPQEAPEQPSAPLQTPVSAPSKTDAPDNPLLKAIERIIDTLSQPSRTKVEQDLAVKFKSHRKRPNTLLEGMEVLLEGAKETEKDIVEHLSLLIKALPPHLQEVQSLPGWLRYFGGDNPAQHSKTSMSNSTSNSGSGAQSNLWGKHEDTKPDAEKYADFL